MKTAWIIGVAAALAASGVAEAHAHSTRHGGHRHSSDPTLSVADGAAGSALSGRSRSGGAGDFSMKSPESSVGGLAAVSRPHRSAASDSLGLGAKSKPRPSKTAPYSF